MLALTGAAHHRFTPSECPPRPCLPRQGLRRGIRTEDIHQSKNMAYKINPETCTACGACAETCPQEAISAGSPAYTIDPEKCIDCGACESACPSGSISPAE